MIMLLYHNYLFTSLISVSAGVLKETTREIYIYIAVVCYVIRKNMYFTINSSVIHKLFSALRLITYVN